MIKNLINLMFRNKVQLLSNSEKNNFFLNDATTPELKLNNVNPKHPKYMPFLVKDFDPRSYSLIRDKDYKNLNCYFIICNLLNYYQSILFKIDGGKIKQWFSNNPLFVDPFARNGMNAFYDRKSLVFMYKNSLFKKRIVYTCESVDIVSHELGHAILDSIRPDFWNMQSIEIWSYHEAFADINAFVNVTNNDLVVEKIFEETNLDLSKSNIASRIGEDMASSISADKFCLRDLSADIDYINPSIIDEKSAISLNPHDFGKIFSCCWYAIFVEIFNFEINNKINPIDAFKIAKEECYLCLIKSTKIVPCNKDFFKTLSKIFLLNIKGKYYKITENVLEKRKLIKKEIRYLSSKDFNISNISKRDCVFKMKNNEMLILKKNSFIYSESNESNMIHSLSTDNPNMEIPFDSFHHISNNIIIDEFESSKEESIESALLCKSYIKKQNYENWIIEDNFLKRKIIS